MNLANPAIFENEVQLAITDFVADEIGTLSPDEFEASGRAVKALVDGERKHLELQRDRHLLTR